MDPEGPVLSCLKAPDHVCAMPTNGGMVVADDEEPDLKDVVGNVERARIQHIHDLGHVSVDGVAVALEERTGGGDRGSVGNGGGRGSCGGSAEGVCCDEQQPRRDEESVEHRVNEDEEVKMERGSEADEDSVLRFFSDSPMGSFKVDQDGLLRREDRHNVLMTSIDVEPTQYGHQVGGHETTGTVTKQTNILRVGDKYVLKAVQDKGRGERELLIYQMLFPESATSGPESDSSSSGVEAELHPRLRELRAFLPRLRGVKEVDGGRYMVLEDLCHDVGPNPSIMDIKIGQVTTAIDAPPEKVQREASKYAYQRQMGFRIVGMKVYDCESGTYRVHGKELGYSLTPEQVPGALASFFLRKRRPSSSVSSPEQQHHLHAFIRRLEALLEWFEAQDLLIFRGSSLLFVDGQETERYDLRMIDLAHVHKIENVRDRVPSCRDDGYIHGLNTLISILKGLLPNTTTNGLGAR